MQLQLTDTVYVSEEGVISAKGVAISDVTPVVESIRLSSPSGAAGDDHLTDDEVSYV